MLKRDILPAQVEFAGSEGEINKEAICIFSAIGFFLDEDTYYQTQRALQPATTYTINSAGEVVDARPWFQWHYSPREISLNQAVDEFTSLFETIMADQVDGRKVILPLSGGLDSRTQAAALKQLNCNVHAYSYAFEGGLDETEYGKQIAEACRFPFEEWKVPAGYLWTSIDQLARLNGCYSEFTHPRQMAFINRYAALGDVFCVGHWGDVLFDDMGVPDNLPVEQQLEVVLKKIVKKGGIELASALWSGWDLKGDFEVYLKERVRKLLMGIDIPDSANARIRAFKSLYWAPRWTAVNLSVFDSVRPVAVPYFDNRMCEFICTIPEKFLAKRKIQIEYLKRRAPELARISWQEHRPFNLYSYKWNRAPYNLPYRMLSKAKRLLVNKKLVQRNWEIQFLGAANESALKHHLFNASFLELVPKPVVDKMYQNFKLKNAVQYSHSISMLLTLSMFAQQQNQTRS